MERLSRSCDHLLWTSTGEAETEKSGAAEAAADWTSVSCALEKMWVPPAKC